MSEGHLQELQYWKFKAKPFESTVDHRFFYPSRLHREALARLNYAIRDKDIGLILFSGEIGSGKTSTVGRFTNNLNRDEFTLIYLENSDLRFHYLIKRIVVRLGIRSSSIKNHDTEELIEIFKALLKEKVIDKNKHLLLIFDEAQDMDLDTLKKVKNLSNIRSSSKNYLTLLLVGQPELRTTIRQLPQLEQRVGIRYYMKSIEVDEIEYYVNHRLKICGASSNPFTKDGMETIFKHTKGNLRKINRLCKFSLMQAFATSMKQIDASIVQTVIDDFEMQDNE